MTRARALRAARLAVSTLTILPVRSRPGEVGTADLAESRYAYPVVGLAIGLILAGLSLAMDRAGTPRGVAAFLIVAAGAALSGGLHLDGLADTADGIFLGGDPARRLAVMRDPHVGSFGVVALLLTLLGKHSALAALAGPPRAWAIVGAATAGRTLILVAAGVSRYARPEGTGRILVQATTPRDASWAAALLLVLTGIACGRAGLEAAGATLILAWGVVRLAERRLGGITGDILGTLVELGELAFLVGMAGAGSRAVSPL